MAESGLQAMSPLAFASAGVERGEPAMGGCNQEARLTIDAISPLGAMIPR